MESENNTPNTIARRVFYKYRFFSPARGHIWLSFPFFIIVARGFMAPIVLLDIYWHLRLGQIIVETLSIPRTDIFSFTAAGKEFIDQSWLADVLFYFIYKAGGFALIVFSSGILLSLILLPLFLLCRKTSPQTGPLVFSLILVAFCLPWNLRPQVFSSVLFSFFYWLLWSYRSKAGPAIYALPILMILWVNLHGAFVMGLVLIAIFLLVELVELLIGKLRDAERMRRLKMLGLILLLCLVATLANPELHRVYDYVLTIMNAASVQKYVTEWQPPVLNTGDGFVMFYLPFFLLTVAFIISKRRPTLMEIALYLCFGAYGMISLRNCVWFLIVSAPMLAVHLSSIEWSAMLPKPALMAIAKRMMRRNEREPINRIIALAMLLVLIMQSPWVRMKLRDQSLQAAETPVGAMDFIERNGLKGNIFHPQIYGDYLIWRLWPKQKSFFDGRVHLFDEAFVKEYSKIFYCSDWEGLLAKYDIKYLLLPNDGKDREVTRIIDSARGSGRWEARYEDKLSILFEKISDSRGTMNPCGPFSR